MTESVNLTKGLAPKRLNYEQQAHSRLTHYLFRYPAKFHPPVVKTLIEQYSKAGEFILDPFCGSGTLLVEALTLGRNVIGSDVDPVAIFVSRVKTRRLSLPRLKISSKILLTDLNNIQRSDGNYPVDVPCHKD